MNASRQKGAAHLPQIQSIPDGNVELRTLFMTPVLWIRLMAFFLVSAGIATSQVFPQHSLPPMQPKPSPAATMVTVDGEVICLPRIAGGQEAQTLECAIGLRTTAGQHYALENITPYLIDGTILMGQHVKISGRLRREKGTRYDTIGLFDVTSVRRLD
jgi:hypothetical protein